MERIICILVGYVFGLFQTGYIVGRAQHVDIRNFGSGNAGSTNALRVLGWRSGILTFIGDTLKCILAILLMTAVYKSKCPDMLPLLRIYTGVGVTLGHNFPFYLKFKGGKGIAVLAGLILSTSWWMSLICFVVFVSVVFATRFISLGSILISLLFAIMLVIKGQTGGFGNIPVVYLYEMYVLGFLLMALAWYRHKANIKRLLAGKENKFGKPDKTQIQKNKESAK